MNDTVPYAELDPGIRETVRWLNENGFETTDSGDGKTKFEDGDAPCCAMDIPNVAIKVDRERLVAETDRLFALLTARGCGPVPAGPEVVPGEVNLQGFYDPTVGDGPAFILVLGLNDQGLDGGASPEGSQR